MLNGDNRVDKPARNLSEAQKRREEFARHVTPKFFEHYKAFANIKITTSGKESTLWRTVEGFHAKPTPKEKEDALNTLAFVVHRRISEGKAFKEALWNDISYSLRIMYIDQKIDALTKPVNALNLDGGGQSGTQNEATNKQYANKTFHGPSGFPGNR